MQHAMRRVFAWIVLVAEQTLQGNKYQRSQLDKESQKILFNNGVTKPLSISLFDFCKIQMIIDVGTQVSYFPI